MSKNEIAKAATANLSSEDAAQVIYAATCLASMLKSLTNSEWAEALRLARMQFDLAA
jgi:hypothetical protein